MSARESGAKVVKDGRKTAAPIETGRPGPRSGDVLASRPTARADLFAISVVPARGNVLAVRRSEAIERIRELARELAVDGWYTDDHTHFVQIAKHRSRFD